MDATGSHWKLTWKPTYWTLGKTCLESKAIWKPPEANLAPGSQPGSQPTGRLWKPTYKAAEDHWKPMLQLKANLATDLDVNTKALRASA
jgi:hypothetical protein